LKAAKKKLGRPPKHKGERLSKNRTFRVRGMLDNYLKWNAEEAGRSVSEEIEARLERSFYTDGLLTTFVGDAAPLVNALSTAVAFSMLLENTTRKDCYQILQVAAGYIIAAFGSSRNATTDFTPKVSEMLWPPRETADRYEVEGLKLAFRVLNNLGSEMPAEQVEDLATLLLEKAGREDAAALQRVAKAAVEKVAKHLSDPQTTEKIK